MPSEKPASMLAAQRTSVHRTGVIFNDGQCEDATDKCKNVGTPVGAKLIDIRNRALYLLCHMFSSTPQLGEVEGIWTTAVVSRFNAFPCPIASSAPSFSCHQSSWA